MKNWRCLFDLESFRKKIKENEELSLQVDFWDNVEKAQEIMKENKQLNKEVKNYDELIEKIEDLEVLIELVLEAEDYKNDSEIASEMKEIEDMSEEFKLKALLNGEFDKNNAILSIHSGAGGLEAQDWAEMLLRMYRRWADDKEYDVETLDLINDTEGGIKAVTLLIKGHNAYGYLKSEKGVHRLVRISPFDSAGKRHTSFASVDIFPEITEEVEIHIDESDIKVDTFRASGAGGQHVNTTDSAIRITHIPTGVVVQCQSERSQHTNRITAMNMLKSKLITLKEEENKEKIEDLQGNYSQIGWGSQIRSYVFHPYSMVKDHRTNAEMGDVEKVMDGSIDYFINESLKSKVMS